MKVHWGAYNHCLFVSYSASVAFGYGWISDTKFQKFSDKDWIWICKHFFGCGSGVGKSISAHLWKGRNPDCLKALYRHRGSNHMRALVAGDTSDA